MINVSGLSPFVEARDLSLVNSCEICRRPSGSGRGLRCGTSVYWCQCHSSNAPYSYIIHARNQQNARAVKYNTSLFSLKDGWLSEKIKVGGKTSRILISGRGRRFCLGQCAVTGPGINRAPACTVCYFQGLKTSLTNSTYWELEVKEEWATLPHLARHYWCGNLLPAQGALLLLVTSFFTTKQFSQLYYHLPHVHFHVMQSPAP